MDWNLINTRNREERENPNTALDLSKYEIKKPKKVNPTYELRVELSKITGYKLPQLFGLTRGWSERDLKGCITDALAFKPNPTARAKNIIKEIHEKRKQIRNKIH